MTPGLAILALFALTGCGGGNSNVVAPVLTSTARSANNLELTVSLPKATFARGEGVPFTMTVKNISTQTLPIEYGDPSALPLIKQGNNFIWGAPDDVPSVKVAQLAPGQRLTFTGTWEKTQTRNQLPAPSGTYSLQGWFNIFRVNGVFLSDNSVALYTFYTNPVSFTILP